MDEIDVFGSDRLIYVKGHGWYFEAREGLQGPYMFREPAESHLQTLMKQGENRLMVWTAEERRSRRESRSLSALFGMSSIRLID